MSQLIPITTAIRTFEDHEGTVTVALVFPDKRQMVTGSKDRKLRLWDLGTGVVLKKMEGHRNKVLALAVSRDDGQMIASGDEGGELTAWHGETDETLTQPIKGHSNYIYSVDFSPDGTVLATGSGDYTTKFWFTKTWQMQPNNQDKERDGGHEVTDALSVEAKLEGVVVADEDLG
ncbi:WD40-repeat-containing domain protein [Suillus subluteus]|nr:WD40-repeat-containing domain protein [Suillus subluteus]